MQDDIAIKVENVSKRFLLPHEKKTSIKSIVTSFFNGKTTYTKQQALEDISFEIKKGEFFGIVGRNGSGKSTLLKIIAGIYQPTKGNISVNGKLVPFIELGVGFNPELTGRENVYLNGSILGFTRKQVQKNYHKIVEFSELKEFMDQKLKNYSSGMQVRLAFACATLAKADILLVDEVLAVGDADFQRKCFEYFKQLKKAKKTVVFVTHDMNSVREYCDRAALINNSRIDSIGGANLISNNYSKLFIDNKNIQKVDKKEVNKDRQGTKKVVITNIHPVGPLNKKNSQIIIKINFKVEKEIDSLNVGFTIKNSADSPILGTNTTIERLEFGKLDVGEIGTVEFSFDNLLNNGKHLVDVLLESDSGEVYDWIIDAITFSVNTEKHTGYIIEPKFRSKFTYEK
jgi:ABC-2 type transport system ATP-binding protein